MSASPTASFGNPVVRLRLAFGFMAALVVACASEPISELHPTASQSGTPVMRNGIVYTPTGIGPTGCVLYRVSVPGGRAPAALTYRSKNGEFSYARPDRCVTNPGQR